MFQASKLCFVMMLATGLSANAIEQPKAKEDTTSEVGAFSTLTLENDIFAGKDGGYTNGIGFSWGYGPYSDYRGSNAFGWMIDLNDFLFIDENDPRQKAVSYTIFQGMQTPEDIKSTELIENDLPYAGILGWRNTLYAWDENVADKFSLVLGIVGPASLAEDTQKAVHSLTGSDRPRGWQHQLRNEPVFSLNAQRSWRFALNPDQEFGTDFLMFASGSAGTYNSDVATSAMIRFGSGLVETFPAVSILPGRDINPMAGSENNHFYMFLGVQARYVFNNILIEGNTFKDSHSVTLKHVGYTVSTGAVWNWEKWGLLFSVAETGSHFKERDGRGRFGSLSISYRF